MRIVQITPGTGTFHCGSCLRDLALVKVLRRLGHEVLLVPMYLPLVTDEAQPESEVYFGGVNVYLQQKSKLFRVTPRWLDQWLDQPGLLCKVAQKAHLTSPEAQGELMLSMLAGAAGRQAKELDRLVAYLRTQPKADVVVLSNAMLLGLAPRLKEGLGVKVVATLQGEDTFVDRLPAELRQAAWGRLSELAQQADGLIAISGYYRDTMAARLHLPSARIDVVYNGIDTQLYAASDEPARENGELVIGYLARMCADKGLHTLVDAYVKLMQRQQVRNVELRITGAMTQGDEGYVNEQKNKLIKAGLLDRVTWQPNVDLAEKVKFLQGLDVLSVPATYGEAFGLYVLEALACGVPVVQPRHGAFPELLTQTGGGVLCDPDDPDDLAEKLGALLADPARARTLGAQGCRAVRERFNMDVMAGQLLAVYERGSEKRG